MNFWLANAPGRSNNVSSAKLVSEENRDRVSTSLPRSAKTHHHQKIDRQYVNKLIRQAEWAEIDAALNEIYLGLCWGDPLEYRYQWAKPKSGCDRIIAADTEPSSIKI